MYSIDVESSFEQMWRYNTIVMCGGYSAKSDQLYVVSSEDIISPLDSSTENPIKCEPEGYELPRKLSLKADKADNIRVIVYVVPHMLPLGREIADFPEFDIDIKITKGKKQIYNSIHQVNQWGGASIEIKL